MFHLVCGLVVSATMAGKTAEIATRERAWRLPAAECRSTESRSRAGRSNPQKKHGLRNPWRRMVWHLPPLPRRLRCALAPPVESLPGCLPGSQPQGRSRTQNPWDTTKSNSGTSKLVRIGKSKAVK